MSLAPKLVVVRADTTTTTASEVKRWVESREQRSVLNAVVTPEIAALLLTYNRPGETNRKISRAGISAAATALRDGLWENTGEPIIVSDECLLNDGQHRLQAVVESGLPATMDLRFGVPRHAFAATNSGGKRTAANALLITGAINSTQVAAVARLVLAYEDGLPAAARQRTTNSRIVQAVERWPDMPESMKYASALPKLLRNAATSTLAFFAPRTANEASIRNFFDVLESGEGRGDNPPHRLREALLRHSGGQDTGTRVRALALCVLSWNAWRSSETLPKPLDWSTRSPFPKVKGLKL